MRGALVSKGCSVSEGLVGESRGVGVKVGF